MSENFIFAYVGISVPLMINNVNLAYVGIGVVALLASRFLSVAIVSCCINPFKAEKIPFSHQIVMTIGGLRGAVAFYLALNVSSEYKHLIITTTISLILFTVIGMGSATPFCLKWMNKTCPNDHIIVKQAEDEVPLANGGEDNYEYGYNDYFGDANIRDREHSIGMISQVERIDKNIFQKYLRKDGWDYYKANADKAGVDVQETYQDVQRRVTKNYGDFSPHRTSHLVDQELQDRYTRSNAKAQAKRALTPPGRKDDDMEKDLRGILKSKYPRKESKCDAFINHIHRC